jgi:hypothetical protein
MAGGRYSDDYCAYYQTGTQLAEACEDIEKTIILMGLTSTVLLVSFPGPRLSPSRWHSSLIA